MKKYLTAIPDIENHDFVSCIDELPLWSAPFGLSLLDKIEMKAGMKVLDIGCGLGFPLIEIAQRLGNTCRVSGIDPWETALDRIRLKLKQNDITNVDVFNAKAESMPFETAGFNLIVSNNGLNNVQDLDQAIRECGRVAAQGAQLVITQNLEGTMKEFYTLFERVLAEKQLFAEMNVLKEHIYHKRRPLGEVLEILNKSGFQHIRTEEHCFYLRVLDAEAFFNHTFIKYWFCDSWKEIIKPEMMEEIFSELESGLNRMAAEKGEIRLPVPYVTVECRKR
jgi:ubiquinone/menaquinone biosynthesis C-methylase UbiE